MECQLYRAAHCLREKKFQPQGGKTNIVTRIWRNHGEELGWRGPAEWLAASAPRAFISSLVCSIQDSHNDCWHDVDKLTQISLARAMQSLSLLSNTRGPHSNSSQHYAKGVGCKVPTSQIPLFQVGNRIHKSLWRLGKGAGSRGQSPHPHIEGQW